MVETRGQNSADSAKLSHDVCTLNYTENSPFWSKWHLALNHAVSN